MRAPSVKNLRRRWFLLWALPLLVASLAIIGYTAYDVWLSPYDTIQPVSYPLLIGRLSVLLVALGLWIIGTMVLALRPALSETFLFALVAQLGAAALAAGLDSALGRDIAGPIYGVLFCILAALLVHLYATFPMPLAHPWRILVTASFYGIALSLSLLSILQALVNGLAPLYPLVFYGVRAFFSVAVLTMLALLTWNAWHAPHPITRQRIRLIAVASDLTLAPLGVLLFDPGFLADLPVPPGVIFLSLLLIPMAFGYAIYRHNLFEREGIVNRSFVYILFGLIVAVLFIALFSFLHGLLPPSSLSDLGTGGLLVALMAWGLPVIQPRLLQGLEKFLYGQWYNYQVVVAEFSGALAGIIEESALAELLVKRLSETIRLRGAALWIAGEGKLLPICHKDTSPAVCALPNPCWICHLALGVLPLDGPLAASLCHEAAPIEHARLKERVFGLSVPERSLLDRPELQVWVPLVLQGELEGVLVLGGKQADDLYSAEDYRILETIAHQAATTTRNVRLVQQLRHRLQELAQSRTDLQEAHRRLLAGREQERKHLAREIHDSPVQDLLGVSYRLRDSQLQTQEAALASSLADLRQESLKIIAELRRICTDLRPPVLDTLGLAAAIRSHAREEVGDRAEVELQLVDEQASLPPEFEIALFRIYQEAVSNAVRHSAATRIKVALACSSDAVTLTVEDNGHGFIIPPRLEWLPAEGHLGLVGMKERVEALQGQLDLHSTPGEGTRIQVSIPIAGVG